CIDAGNNEADAEAFVPGINPLPEVDALGNPRAVDTPGAPDCWQQADPLNCGTPPIVDMGAYEFQPFTPVAPGVPAHWWDLEP
ncbi:MAG: hypothetical protein JSU63_09560, partial [Phycisphaerales bacterium]